MSKSNKNNYIFQNALHRNLSHENKSYRKIISKLTEGQLKNNRNYNKSS